MFKKIVALVLIFFQLNLSLITANANQVYTDNEILKLKEVAKLEGFDNLRIDEDTGVLMIDKQLNTSVSDKIAIETFSIEIFYFLENDLPEIKNGILFFGFFDNYIDDNLAATLMFFDEYNANQNWKYKPIKHDEMYKQATKFDCMSFLSKYIDYESRLISEDDPIDMLMFYSFGSTKDN